MVEDYSQGWPTLASAQVTAFLRDAVNKPHWPASTRSDPTLPAPRGGTAAPGGFVRHRCAGGRRARLRGPRPPDRRLPT